MQQNHQVGNFENEPAKVQKRKLLVDLSRVEGKLLRKVIRKFYVRIRNYGTDA